MLVRREAMALRDYGLDVDVVCLRGSDQGATEEIDGIHVHRLPLSRTKGGLGRYLYDYVTFYVLVAFKLTVQHLRRRYVFIQINTMPDFLVFATLIPRLLGAKITLQMYEPTPELWAARLGLICEEDLRRSSFRQHTLIRTLRWIQQASVRYAHAVFTVTQQLKDNLVAHGANPDKISVVLNVPDTRLFGLDPGHGARNFDEAVPQNGFTMICHGAIEERYGHDTMLRAIAAVKSSIPELELRITGSGSYLDEFLEQVESLGLQDRVKYLGYVSLSQLVTELDQADWGIVAQKSSLYSNLVHTGKMYDCLAFGKPVIVSRLQAVQAYFDPDSLCYFTPGDAKDLAEVLLELYRDLQRRMTLTRNANRLYERYRWENQREVYWTTYASLES